MTQSETTLNEWSEVGKLKPVGFGLYTKLFIIVAAYFIFPVLAAYFLNLMGWMKGNWVLMSLMALLDYFILFYPYAWLAIAGAGFAAGQPGGTKGWSNEEGIKKVKEWVPGVYRFAVRTIIGKQAVFILLAFLPVAGNQATTAVILGTVLFVILGSSISDEAWKGHPFTRTVYFGLCVLLTLAIAYWAVVTVWPDLRPFKAKAITTEVEKEIRRQHETVLNEALQGGILIKKEDAIKEKMLAMKPHLTLEERLAELTPAERRVWEAANSNIAERALHGLKEQAGKIDKKVRSWSKDGSPATAAGAINAPVAADASNQNLTRWPQNGYSDFTPGKESMSLGNFEAGTYCIHGSGEYQLRILYAGGTSTDVKLDKSGRWVGAGHGTQLPYSGADAHPAPFGNQPIGAVYALVNGQPVESSIGGHRFTVGAGEEIRLDVNAPTHAANRVTNGALKLRVEEC